MAEKKDKTEGQEEKWAKYARKQLIKSYSYLGFLFVAPIVVLYLLGAPFLGCVAAGFLVTFFFGVYTLETLPNYGDTAITGGQGKAEITLEEFNCKMKRKYWTALVPASIALVILVWMFLDKQETGRIDPFWLSAFALLVLGIRIFCAPVKKVLILTGPIIMIFSPFVIIGHLVWTCWVLLSKQPYPKGSELTPSDGGYSAGKAVEVNVERIRNGKIERWTETKTYHRR